MLASRDSLRALSALGLILAAMALASGAFAAGTSPPPPPPRETPSSPEMPTGFGKAAADSSMVRAEAEKSYAKGWEMCEDAKKVMASGKDKDAKKRFGKALKKFNEATELDPRYFEAWNMVGYCSRKSGDLTRSFEAYMKCLEIEPEYAQAHEYLGEAYLMTGNLPKAKEQLMWLVARKSEQAGELATKIEEFEKGKGAPGTVPAAAQGDSTSQGSGW